MVRLGMVAAALTILSLAPGSRAETTRVRSGPDRWVSDCCKQMRQVNGKQADQKRSAEPPNDAVSQRGTPPQASRKCRLALRRRSESEGIDLARCSFAR